MNGPPRPTPREMEEQNILMDLSSLPFRIQQEAQSLPKDEGGESSKTIEKEDVDMSSSLETPPPSSMESEGTLANLTPNSNPGSISGKPIEIIDLSGPDPEYRPRTPPGQPAQDAEESEPRTSTASHRQRRQSSPAISALIPTTPSSKRKLQMMLTPDGKLQRPIFPIEPDSPSKRRTAPARGRGRRANLNDNAEGSSRIPEQMDVEMQDACQAVAKSTVTDMSEDKYWAQVHEEVTKQRALNPICNNCLKHTKKVTVSKDSQIGNHGRVCYRCDTCNRFHSWGDDRGVHEDNPPCLCEGEGKDGKKLARLAIASRRGKATERGSLYWECAKTGGTECRHWEIYVDKTGEPRVLSDDDIVRWKVKGMI